MIYFHNMMNEQPGASYHAEGMPKNYTIITYNIDPDKHRSIQQHV